MDRSNIVILNEKVEKQTLDIDQSKNKILNLTTEVQFKEDEIKKAKQNFEIVQSNLQNMQSSI